MKRYIKNFFIRIGVLLLVLFWFVMLLPVVFVMAPILWIFGGFDFWTTYIELLEYFLSAFSKEDDYLSF